MTIRTKILTPAAVAVLIFAAIYYMIVFPISGSGIYYTERSIPNHDPLKIYVRIIDNQLVHWYYNEIHLKYEYSHSIPLSYVADDHYTSDSSALPYVLSHLESELSHIVWHYRVGPDKISIGVTPKQDGPDLEFIKVYDPVTILRINRVDIK